MRGFKAGLAAAALVAATVGTSGTATGATAYAVAPTGAVVPTVTAMSFGGGYLYATNYALGTVVRMKVLPYGLLGPVQDFATGFESPLGVAVGPDGTVFVADSHDAGGAIVGRVWAIPSTGGVAGTVGDIVVDDLPNGRHNTNNLEVHGGRLYVTNGNSTDDGITGGDPEQALSGTILSLALSARNVDGTQASADLVVEAEGLRNVYDVAFRPGTDEIWSASNGPDFLDPWGEDLLHKLEASEATVDFGFPECVYRAGPGGPTDPEVGDNTAYPGTCNAAGHRAPEATLGLHVSADGLDFAPTTGGWDGSLFIAEWGALQGTGGHALVRVPVDSTGAVTGAPQAVLTLPTPLALAFGPGGLYVGDFGAGQILLVTPVL